MGEIGVCRLEGWVFLLGGGIVFVWFCEDVDKSILIEGWTRLDVGMTPNVVSFLGVKEGIYVDKILGIEKSLVIGKFLSVGESDEKEATPIDMVMFGLVM